MNAVARLEASRARLREGMRPAPAAPEAAGSGDARPAASWLAQLKGLPVIDLVAQELHEWWSRHPLRPVVLVAAEASNAVARPLARRHPLVLVLSAAVVGAALVRGRTWRWAFRSALFAGLVPQLASRIVSNLPIESWMTLLGAALARVETPRSPAGVAATVRGNVPSAA